jgi:hypothetical protein
LVKEVCSAVILPALIEILPALAAMLLAWSAIIFYKPVASTYPSCPSVPEAGSPITAVTESRRSKIPVFSVLTASSRAFTC